MQIIDAETEGRLIIWCKKPHDINYACQCWWIFMQFMRVCGLCRDEIRDKCRLLKTEPFGWRKWRDSFLLSLWVGANKSWDKAATTAVSFCLLSTDCQRFEAKGSCKERARGKKFRRIKIKINQDYIKIKIFFYFKLFKIVYVINWYKSLFI